MEHILEKIYKSSLKFLEPLNLDGTYKIIVDEAVKLVNGESGGIFRKAKASTCICFKKTLYYKLSGQMQELREFLEYLIYGTINETSVHS